MGVSGNLQEDKEANSSPREVKLMSNLLIKQPTPKQIDGIEIDEKFQLKM